MSKQMMGSELMLGLQEKYLQDVERIGEGFQQALLVKPERLIEFMGTVKNEPLYQFNMLSNLTAVDYVEYFELVYHLYSLPLRQALTVKSRCNKANPQMPSVTSIWISANFQEREVYDLLGVSFTGHPDLRRILMPDDFPYHPLRKDYKLIPRGEKR